MRIGRILIVLLVYFTFNTTHIKAQTIDLCNVMSEIYSDWDVSDSKIEFYILKCYLSPVIRCDDKFIDSNIVINCFPNKETYIRYIRKNKVKDAYILEVRIVEILPSKVTLYFDMAKINYKAYRKKEVGLIHEGEFWVDLYFDESKGIWKYKKDN